MKNTAFSLFTLVLIAVTLVSCVSISDRTIPRYEMDTVEVIGKAQTTFTSWQPLYIIRKKAIVKKAYSRLLQQAQDEYGKNVDIRNIQITGGFSGHNLWVPLIVGGTTFISWVSIISRPYWIEAAIGVPVSVGSLSLGVSGNFQKITATGDVIVLEQPTESQSRSRIDRANATGIEKAIYTISDDLIRDLPERATVAVISVSSNTRDLSALVVDELEFHLVSARKFTIVDRRTLDTIRSEQNFQLSGDVSDASAVSIGQLLGANIVITGSITAVGANQRLSIRALDVNTAQIVTMVRETF